MFLRHLENWVESLKYYFSSSIEIILMTHLPNICHLCMEMIAWVKNILFLSVVYKWLANVMRRQKMPSNSRRPFFHLDSDIKLKKIQDKSRKNSKKFILNGLEF